MRHPVRVPHLFPALAAGVSLACAGDPLGPEAEVLVREVWEWTSACCGIAGIPKTPETEGYVYVLRFSRDGTVQASRDGALLVETTFTGRRAGPPEGGNEITTVQYGTPLPLGPGIADAPAHMMIVLEGGGLLLRNLAGCADCYADWRFLPRLE